jgi:hypothetical protein
MGHPQNATTISTDNSTATGKSNSTVKQRRSKAINMHYNWVCDRVSQGQFTVVWKKGQHNLADYFTKNHPKSHHAAICSTYLYHSTNSVCNYFHLLLDDKCVSGEGVLIHRQTRIYLSHSTNPSVNLCIGCLTCTILNHQ